MRFDVVLAALLLLPAGARAQDRTIPPDPSVTPLPPVAGKGVQIYHCQQQQGSPAWIFVAPEATLYAGTESVGTHSAGPTWRWKDGSAVTGRVLINQRAPDGTSIPWLLLAASPAIDSTPTGMLAHVSYVRRSDTHGGMMPPAGCDARHLGAIARVPYTAAYTFYKAPDRPAPGAKRQ
jgi:FtsP/CotA-like multicopper oxidase with cupredoxin domain